MSGLLPPNSNSVNDLKEIEIMDWSRSTVLPNRGEEALMKEAENRALEMIATDEVFKSRMANFELLNDCEQDEHRKRIDIESTEHNAWIDSLKWIERKERIEHVWPCMDGSTISLSNATLVMLLGIRGYNKF